ncbi:MAG: hypothetical protein OEW08_12650 [Gammaproteobacteria bacterium]|nr:hypothetical protein [Gammaproteobacteria bacterium]
MKSYNHSIAALLLIASTSASAEQWNLVFGLSQPLVTKGGNIEINYLTEKFVFEYSHGFALNLSTNKGIGMTGIEKSQHLDIYVPYSTGGGAGYRFTKEFNVRLEIKQHQFNVAHPSGENINYTTRDIGVGAYYFWLPFNSKYFLIVPSIRYWPTVYSRLKNDEFTFSNGDVHKAHSFGLFGNVSIGWRF